MILMRPDGGKRTLVACKATFAVSLFIFTYMPKQDAFIYVVQNYVCTHLDTDMLSAAVTME